METIKTIADIRAVNYWGWVTPIWDGFSVPKPEKNWSIIRHEIQTKDPSGTWTPIEVVDVNKDGTNAN